MNPLQILAIITITLEIITLTATVFILILAKITRKATNLTNANLLSISGKITMIMLILTLNAVVVLTTLELDSLNKSSHIPETVIYLLVLLLLAVPLSILSFKAVSRSIMISSKIKNKSYSCYIRPFNQSDEQKAGGIK